MMKNFRTRCLLLFLTLLSIVLSPGCETLFQKKVAAVPITFSWAMYYEEGQTFGDVVGVELLSAAGIGVLLLGIDYIFKAGYGLTPRELSVTLTKADGKLRVEIILLDVDELRNVKWIRVRSSPSEGEADDS